MKRLAFFLLLTTTAWAQERPVHTFSIVARDQQTGELGVAVQSHWFAVGTAVPWAEAGVGAVVTQSFADPSYGKLGLDLMRELTARLPKSSLLPDDATLVKKIQSQ